MNEAARIVEQITGMGYSRKFVADVLGVNSSYVTQFFSKGKGGTKVPALQALLNRVQADASGGRRTLPAEAAPAVAPLNPHRQQQVRTRSGWRSKQGAKGLQRAGKDLTAKGAPAVTELVRAAAADVPPRKLFFTVSVPKGTAVHGTYDPSAGKYVKGAGGRRYSRERELEFGNRGRGFDAAEFANLVDQYGSAPAAMSQWMMLKGWTDEPPKILRIEVRAS